MKVTDYIIIVVFAVASILLMPILLGDKDPSFNSEIIALEKANDSLKSVIAFQDSLANKKEKEYRKATDSVEAIYKGKIADLDKKYQKEKRKLKELTLDQQVALLDSNLCSPIAPKLIVLEGDSNVLIKPTHVESINETYLERDMLIERVAANNQQIDTLSYYIKSGLAIIDLKNNVISSCNALNVNNDKVILDLKETNSQQSITFKKQLFKTFAISLGVGMIIGTTLILL